MSIKHDQDDSQLPSSASFDQMVRALDRAYHRPFYLMWRAFLQGMMAAFGAFVGTAIIGLISVYLFNLLGGIQLFKPVIDTINTSVQKNHTASPSEN